MIKWFWILLVSAISLGMLSLAVVGISPKIIKVVDPSYFANFERIGFHTYRRLYQEVNDSPVILLGSSPFLPSYQLIWQGLLSTAQKYRPQEIVLLEYDYLQPIAVPTGTVVRKGWQMGELLSAIREARGEGKQVIVHTLNTESSHMFEKSLHRQIFEKLKIKPWAISQSQFFVNAQELAQLQPPCVDLNEATKFSCLSLRISKQYFRKKFPEDHILSAIEKYGERDFVLFVHPSTPTK